jgi:hypothetical protein
MTDRQTPRRCPRGPRRRSPAAFAAAGLLLLPALAAPAAARPAALGSWSLDLPGAPAAVIPADLNGDGRLDLAVVVAYQQWDRIAIEESTTMDGIEGLIEVMTVVPYLLDRREVRVFLGTAGAYQELPAPLPLPLSVLSMEAGPPGLPVLALTDDGVSALRLGPGNTLRLEPILADPPVLAGTGGFVSNLGMVRDVTGDGAGDLLLPAEDGLAVYPAVPGGLAAEPSARIPYPGERTTSGGDLARLVPLPEVEDLDGDGRPDLLFRDPRRGWAGLRVAVNAGDGRFRPPVAPFGEEEEKEEEEPSTAKLSPRWVGDLDGDGLGEFVTVEEIEKEDASMRQEMQQVREPRIRVRLHRLGRDLRPSAEPYRTFEAKGYALEGEESDRVLPSGLQDLDGDGRKDLVTATMDLTIRKAMMSMATKRLTLGLDFHVWCQQADGGFRPVSGLDLSGKFKINFNDLKVRQRSLFAGDFDGDGRADFVQLGRGRKVTIHRGRPGCSFPASPDLTVTLRDEPADISLVQVRDFDGDGRSDLLVVQPKRASDPGVAPPVRLDFHLSGLAGGGR